MPFGNPALGLVKKKCTLEELQDIEISSRGGSQNYSGWALIIILHSSKRQEATARLFSPCCVRAKEPCPEEVPVPNAVLGLSHAHAACSSATTARCLAMKC